MNIYTHKASKTEARRFRGKKVADESCRHYLVIETSHVCGYDCGDDDSEFGCGCNGASVDERLWCGEPVNHAGQHSVLFTNKITLNWDE